MRRGVSGGERKRVSVGHELLINPSIIFLDEPTSGLDSTTALSLVSTLHVLANGGRTVVTTIHQPSSRMFQKLEKLMLLSEGRILYYGYNANCVDWLKGLDAPCPFGINVADFILDLANANQGNSKDEGQEIRAFQVNAFKMLSEHPDFNVDYGVVAELIPLATKFKDELKSQGPQQMHSGKAAPSGGGAGAAMIKSISSMGSIKPPAAKEDKTERSWGSSWPSQFTVLFHRSILTRRFESLGLQRAIQLLGVSVIAGLLFFQLGGKDTLKSAMDVTGLLFFLELFPAFAAMFAALFVFPTDMRMLVKERQSGMYRLSAFYVSRTLSDLPMDCLIPSGFVLILYFMGGLRLSAAAFFSSWLTVLTTLLTAQSVGLVLGAAVTDVKIAQTAATLIMLTMMLSGGFFVSYVPAWISWIKYLSFLSYAFNILLHIEFQGRTIYSCPDGGDTISDACTPVNLKDTLGFSKDPNDSVAFDVGMLFVLLIFLRIAIYFVLNSKTKQKR